MYYKRNYKRVRFSVQNLHKLSLGTSPLRLKNYLDAIESLNSLHFGFKDVEMFLLKPKLNVLLNLAWLGVPVEYVVEALNRSRISERRVCVQWWKLGRCVHGFRLRDELHSRSVNLGGVAAYDKEVLGVLHRGAIHEVLRVQISNAKRMHSSWSQLVAQV
ncbi:uncharacterized protein LOC142518529 [Primulina tabacum]|uniref:uncharacterized protein LOC142518529 n=1 Tax=Primulina tabacum TaxID=48773 RepID=UPI003F5A3906